MDHRKQAFSVDVAEGLGNGGGGSNIGDGGGGGIESTTTATSGPGLGQGQGPGLGQELTSNNNVSRTTRTTSSTIWSSYVLNKRDMDLARLQLLNTRMRLDQLSSEEVTTITSHLLTTVPQVQALFATITYDQAHGILCQLVAASSVVHLKRSSVNPMNPRLFDTPLLLLLSDPPFFFASYDTLWWATLPLFTLAPFLFAS